MSIEHPVVTRLNMYGYLEDEDKPVLDYFGNEVYLGEEVIIDEDGDFVAINDFEDFLIKKFGFKFKELEYEDL